MLSRPLKLRKMCDTVLIFGYRTGPIMELLLVFLNLLMARPESRVRLAGYRRFRGPASLAGLATLSMS